jgi:type IV pilus assembly protein PilA
MSFVERCRQRHLGSEGGDEGFTLIELLVVLLIIGILLAIAIPTFLSVTKGANNTAAQSNLQTALTGAKTYYTQSNQSFQGLMTGVNTAGATSSIQAIDTGLSYVSAAGAAGDSTGPHLVSVNSNVAGTDLVLTTFANGTNDCWGILDVTSTGSTIDAITGSAGVGTYFFVNRSTTAANCNSAGYLAGTTAVSASSVTGFPHG